nr:hypothetical protein [Tanacetum cinerariifolium]
MGKFKETLAEGTLHLGPERDRVVADLTPEEKERYKADIRVTNIILQGFELTKDERESQLYDDFEHFRQNKGEDIYEYYVRFAKLNNDMRNIKMTMPKMQLNSKFMNNMLPKWGRFMTIVKLNRGLKTSNYDQLYAYLKQHEENRVVLDEEKLLFIADGQTNTFDDDVDAAQVMFMANLSSTDPIYDEAGPSYDSDILSEVQDHDNYIDHVGEYHEVHEMQKDVQPNYGVDSDAKYTSDSNIILYE